MMISIDLKKDLTKSMIKMLKKLGIEGNFFTEFPCPDEVIL